MKHSPEFLESVADRILLHHAEFQLADSSRDGLTIGKAIRPKTIEQEFKAEFNCYLSQTFRNLWN